MERWEWGELYVWGGVTWLPDRQDRSNHRKAIVEDIWKAVSRQYPQAARRGNFAGMPLSPVSAVLHFENLVQVLSVSQEQALELVQIDATPLLVEPEGVRSVFEELHALAGEAGEGKALQLVKRHPGLLVGGANLKAGASLVTSALVDLVFAGRLKTVIQDETKPASSKLTEIEGYTKLAEFCKPFMDLLQRLVRW